MRRRRGGGDACPRGRKHHVGAFEVQDGAEDRLGGLIGVAGRLEVVNDLAPLQRIFPEVLLDVPGRDGNDVVEVLRGGGGAHVDERYGGHGLIGYQAQFRQTWVRAVQPGSTADSSPSPYTPNCDEPVIPVSTSEATLADQKFTPHARCWISAPKGHEKREVPIPRFLVDQLAEHVPSKAPDDLVFAGVRGGGALRGPISAAPRSTAPPKRSASPASTRTSSVTPPRAWLSPPAPT